MPFEIFQSENDQKFYFRLKAGNGEIILQSKGYSEKTDVVNIVNGVVGHSAHHGNFARKKSEDGQHFFTLIDSNADIIGKSEMYKSVDGMENGILSVMKNSEEGAEVKDLA